MLNALGRAPRSDKKVRGPPRSSAGLVSRVGRLSSVRSLRFRSSVRLCLSVLAGVCGGGTGASVPQVPVALRDWLGPPLGKKHYMLHVHNTMQVPPVVLVQSFPMSAGRLIRE
jgi:hypothetical protein